MSDPSSPRSPYQPEPWQAPPTPGPSNVTRPYGGPSYTAPQGYPPRAAWPTHPGRPTMPGYPPQPVRKRPAAPVVGVIVAVVALVTCAGIVTVAYSMWRGGSGPSAATPKPSASSTTGAAGGAKQLRLAAPDTIGRWRKTADQDRAHEMSDALDDSAITEPFAAQYQDTETASRIAVLWGGTGRAFGGGREQDQLSSYMSQLTQGINGGVAVTPVPVDPGMIGGVAACAPTAQYGVTITACLWIADGVLLGFMFTDVQPDEAGGYVHAMLPAVVLFS